MKKILLFDIDGTIVRVGSAFTRLHHDADIYAIKKIFGVEILEKDFGEYGGMTDMGILTVILKDKGVNDELISKDIRKLFPLMVEYFSEGIGSLSGDGIIIDGVADTLEQLSRDNEVIIGLLTGNVQDIARMKLEKLGLWQYFKIGGFGDSSLERADLIGIATAQALEKGLVDSIDLRSVYVIGDTKHDINCAKVGGAVSVAVATGKYSKKDLEVYHPDYMLGNLTELIPILKNSK